MHPSALGRTTLMIAALSIGLSSTAGGAAAADRPTPSGRPVPRWVSLRSNTVNARANPGRDEALLWVYHARGLPLQVIAETGEWRLVCDPEGSISWIENQGLQRGRRLMNIETKAIPIRERRSSNAVTIGVVPPSATVALRTCAEGWCAIKARTHQGWVPLGQLWGSLDYIHCRGVVGAHRRTPV